MVVVTGLEAAPRNTNTDTNATVHILASNLKTVHRRKPYQVGTASWYGRFFHGKETASGEPFNMYQFTAAHRQLPLGTLVRVTNLRNGESVIVRINDRGPEPRDRIIDLSWGAARMIGLSGYGVGRVRLDVVKPAPEVARLQAMAP
jgi:rare lipoprotein A